MIKTAVKFACRTMMWMLMPAALMAQTTQVTVTNGDFTQPGVDTEDWTTVPGWDEIVGNSNGSGVTAGGVAWQGFETAVANVTTDTLQAGEAFTVELDYHSSWQSTTCQVDLIAWDANTSTATVLDTTTFSQSSPDSAGPWMTDLTHTFDPIDSGFANLDTQHVTVGLMFTQTESGAWMEIDNVTLTTDGPVRVPVELNHFSIE